MKRRDSMQVQSLPMMLLTAARRKAETVVVNMADHAANRPHQSNDRKHTDLAGGSAARLRFDDSIAARVIGDRRVGRGRGAGANCLWLDEVQGCRTGRAVGRTLADNQWLS